MTRIDALRVATSRASPGGHRRIDLGVALTKAGTYRIDVSGIEAAGGRPWLLAARDPAWKAYSEITLASPDGERLQFFVAISHAFDRLHLVVPAEARFAPHAVMKAKRIHGAVLLAETLRRAPWMALAAAGWRLVGKRVRARNRVNRILGSIACLEYRRHLAQVQGNPAGAGDAVPAGAAFDIVRLTGGGKAPTPSAAETPARWRLVLGPGMRLAKGARERIAAVAVAHAGAVVIYFDDDVTDAEGNRRAPRFKPGWSPDYFLAAPYIGAALIRSDALDAIGALNAEADAGALDAAILALAAAHPRGAIVRVPEVLIHRDDASADDTAEAHTSAYQARRAHLARHEPDAELRPLDGAPHLFRVVRPLPAPPPLVSIIVPTRDGLELLAPCLEGVLHRTRYPAVEVIVADNGSEQPATRAYLEKLKREEPRVRVLDVAGPFNFSGINNTAVGAARGDVLCFLNNDIEVIEPDWLAEMVTHALRPGIGAVGAKLLYPGGLVQHGGVILGLNGLAGHAHRFFPARHPGYMDRLRTVQNYTAVTAACLVVQRARFEAVGGFDAERFAVAFNDVDLCLKLFEAGYLNVWTPHATLLHKESATRASDYSAARRVRFAAECAALKARWSHLLADDPFYNCNLTQLREDFTVD